MTPTAKRGRGIKGSLVSAAVALASLAVSASPSRAGDTIKVAFSLDYLMNSPAAATAWFNGVKSAFEKAHPGDTLQLIPIPGGYDDFLTKLSLLYNSRSTEPDVIQYAAVTVGQFAASGSIAPLDAQVTTDGWWKTFPSPVKAEGTIDGKIYGISEGVNTFALLYDHTLFSKAGLPSTWSPHSWSDILVAARAIKKTSPDSWPIWLITGTAQGTFGVVAGPGMLVATSSDPTILDPKTGKWVVDSKGLREVLSFYRDAAKEGLLAPSSKIMDPNAPNNSGTYIPKHTIGISFAGNWIPTDWGKAVCLPCWDPKGSIGFAPIPTSAGQAPGAGGPFGGWDLSVSAKSKHPDLAWSAVEIMQEKANLLSISSDASLVPPVPAYASDSYYLGLAPTPFQAEFAQILTTENSMPSSPEFPIWAYALQQATQTMVLKPDSSIDDAIKEMRSYVVNQLGPDRVETHD